MVKLLGKKDPRRDTRTPARRVWKGGQARSGTPLAHPRSGWAGGLFTLRASRRGHMRLRGSEASRIREELRILFGLENSVFPSTASGQLNKCSIDQPISTIKSTNQPNQPGQTAKNHNQQTNSANQPKPRKRLKIHYSFS